MADDNALISRSEFETAVWRELSLHPYIPSVHSRKINPYTGARITCEADYSAYVREKVFHQLCEEAARCAVSGYKSSVTAEMARLKSNLSEQTRRYRRRFSFGLIAAAGALCAILFWYVPKQTDSAYQNGVESGYSDGYSVGSEAGYVGGYAAGMSDGIASQKQSGNTGTIVNNSGNDITTYQSIPASTTVYISNSGKIHINKSCSGMRYYTTMTYGEAVAAGYEHCRKCF